MLRSLLQTTQYEVELWSKPKTKDLEAFQEPPLFQQHVVLGLSRS